MLRCILFILIVAVPFCSFAQNHARFSDIIPGMHNRSIERQAIWLANRKGQNYNWRETYKMAKIISREWTMEFDKDGFSKGRKIHVELYGVLPTGKCVMTDFTFRQKLLINETYSRELYYTSVGDMVYVDCE